VKLREEVSDNVDRHREADADVARARAGAEYRRVDADHFAPQVQQWTA